MKIKSSVMALSLGVALAGSAIAETTVIVKEPEVRTIVTDAGYSEPTVVVREAGLWRVQSVDGDTGNEITVFVTPAGKLLGAAEVTRTRMAKMTVKTEKASEPVTEATVASTVMAAGFHNVHDIDFLDSRGVWKAEADDITGEDYEIHVDATTAQIVHIEDD